MTSLEDRLGYRFNDPGLLTHALTHRSWCAEHEGEPSNERLEFLGDAVLQLVVTDHLFARFPDLTEGHLAKIRAAVVSARALADVGAGLGLGAGLRLGNGEDASGGREKASILADAAEAVIGAIYLDGGIGPSATLVIAELEAGLEGMIHISELGELASDPMEAFSPGQTVSVTITAIDAEEGRISLGLNAVKPHESNESGTQQSAAKDAGEAVMPVSADEPGAELGETVEAKAPAEEVAGDIDHEHSADVPAEAEDKGTDPADSESPDPVSADAEASPMQVDERNDSDATPESALDSHDEAESGSGEADASTSPDEIMAASGETEAPITAVSDVAAPESAGQTLEGQPTESTPEKDEGQ